MTGHWVARAGASHKNKWAKINTTLTKVITGRVVKAMDSIRCVEST